MKQGLGSILGVLMAVVLAVTSLSAAYARGQAEPAGTMVICRGLTVMTVLVDGDGLPIEETHVCPDAALAFFFESGEQRFAVSHVLVWRPVDWDAPTLVVDSFVFIAAQARGPPVFL